MPNFLVGGSNKIEVKVSAIAADNASPENGGDMRLLGGTQSGFNISSDTVDSSVFEDEMGFTYGVVTGQSWDIPWTANLLADDPAHKIVKEAAFNAVSGSKVGITVIVKNKEGGTVISQLDGVAIVTNYAEDYPADGILTYNCTFTGYGKPLLV